MDPIIKFSNVSKSFRGNLVLDKVSFELKPNSITTLIGPNGAGKSTVARLMLGIEKPNSGKIYSFSKNISYIPQKIDFNSNIPMDVNSLVKYISGGKNTNNDIASFAELQKWSNKQINELSGGTLQKILLAASLLRNPDLIVLDEPTQGLDISAQQDFYHLLEDLRKSYKITIFMISHDLYAVMKSSDQVLCLNNHICCSGKPEILTDKKTQLKDIALYTHNHDHKHL